ncbi:hypothetical protein QP65_00250, partial [Staphylococcus aureus]
MRRFGGVVERVFRDLDGHVLGADLGLAGQARRGLQAPGAVEVVLFQLVGLVQRVETLADHAVARGAGADAAAGAFDLDVVVMGHFKDGLTGFGLHHHSVRTELLVGQKNHLRHQLLLDLIQVAPGQSGFYRRIKAAGGKGIGHLRQTLGLLLDGGAIGTVHQITQVLHLLFDRQALFGVQQALAIGVHRALPRFEQTLGVD